MKNKHFKSRLIASILMPAVLVALNVAPLVSAHDGGHMPVAQTQDIPQDSGFTDEHGEPVSVQEYDDSRSRATKNVFERYPIPSTIVAIAVVSGVLYLLTQKRRTTTKTKKKK